MQFQMDRATFTEEMANLSSALGETVSADSGTVSHKGVTVRYSYDGTTLDVEVVEKPFFVDRGYIEAQIASWLTSR